MHEGTSLLFVEQAPYLDVTFPELNACANCDELVAVRLSLIRPSRLR
jgi:hypothetical protein